MDVIYDSFQNSDSETLKLPGFQEIEEDIRAHMCRKSQMCNKTENAITKLVSQFEKKSITHVVWKSRQMSHLDFSDNFCPNKIDLSGNSVWPQVFKELAQFSSKHVMKM